MSQKQSRVKINVDLVKIRKAEKDPREVQKRLLDFFQKKGFSYKVHIGYLYHGQMTQEGWQQILAELKECGLAQFIHDVFCYDVTGKILVVEDGKQEYRQLFQKYMVVAKMNCQIMDGQIRKKQIYIKNNKKKNGKRKWTAL